MAHRLLDRLLALVTGQMVLMPGLSQSIYGCLAALDGSLTSCTSGRIATAARGALRPLSILLEVSLIILLAEKSSLVLTSIPSRLERSATARTFEALRMVVSVLHLDHICYFLGLDIVFAALAVLNSSTAVSRSTTGCRARRCGAVAPLTFSG